MFNWNWEILREVIFAESGFFFLFRILAYVVLALLAIVVWKRLTRPSKTYVSRYPWIGKIRFVFVVLAVSAFCVLAIARPYLPRGGKRIRHGTVECVVAVDYSFSMLAPDVHPIRLEAAKQLILKLVAAKILREGDRAALFAFNRESFTRVHLTKDLQAFADSVSRLRRPKNFLHDESFLFTNIPLVLEDICKRLDDQDKFMGEEPPLQKSNRFVLLFTDGADESEKSMNELAEVVKGFRERKMKVYPIGIGTKRGYGLANILDWHGYRRGEDYNHYIGGDWRGANERAVLKTDLLVYLRDHTDSRMYLVESKFDINGAVQFLENVVASHRSGVMETVPEEGRFELWEYCLYGALIFTLLLIFIY